MINRVLPNSYFDFLSYIKNLSYDMIIGVMDSVHRECLNTSVSTNAFVAIVSKKDIIDRFDFLYHDCASDYPLKYLFFDLKANYNTKSTETKNNSSCSSTLQHYESPIDCYIYEVMIKKGGIFIGKTNCDEFACGDLSQFSCYGPTVLNGESPGGSSGGAAISAKYATFVSFGTDTGGSVRQPALRLGLYAVKPTFGTISVYGITLYSTTLDHVGIIGSDLDSIELVFENVYGYDHRYSCSIDHQYVKVECLAKKPCIAVIIDSGMNNTCMTVLKQLEDFANVVFIELPISIKHINFVYHIISSAEFFSNTNRFDLLKFNDKFDKASLSSFWSKRYYYLQRSSNMKMLYGAIALSEYNKNLYQVAMKMRSVIINKFDELFKEFDVIITNGFCEMTSYSDDDTDIYRDDNEAYLRLANILGVPSIVFPTLPRDGLQVIGRRLEDNNTFFIARTINKRIKAYIDSNE